MYSALRSISSVFTPPSKVPRQLQRQSQPVRGVSARDGHLLPAAPPLALHQSIAL